MDTATVVVTMLLAGTFMFSVRIKLLGVPGRWPSGVRELAGVAGVLVGLVRAVIGVALAIAAVVLHTPCRRGRHTCAYRCLRLPKLS
jgi:Na+/serine symporter